MAALMSYEKRRILCCIDDCFFALQRFIIMDLMVLDNTQLDANVEDLAA